MRKHFSQEWVCRSMPSRGVVYLEAKTLKDIVDKGMQPISSASTCAQMAQEGLSLGNLCAEAGHPMWALKVWKFTLGEIHAKDYDDWIDVYFNTEYVRLKDVISDGVCEVIGRRIDDVERIVGLSDAHGRDSWEYRAGDGWYNDLWYEKYDFDWEEMRESYVEMRDEALERQQREQLFLDAQHEQVPQPQDFFDHWNDYTPVVQEDLHFKIDDWD